MLKHRFYYIEDTTPGLTVLYTIGGGWSKIRYQPTLSFGRHIWLWSIIRYIKVIKSISFLFFFSGKTTYPKEIQISTAHSTYDTAIPKALIIGRITAIAIAPRTENMTLKFSKKKKNVWPLKLPNIRFLLPKLYKIFKRNIISPQTHHFSCMTLLNWFNYIYIYIYGPSFLKS